MQNPIIDSRPHLQSDFAQMLYGPDLKYPLHSQRHHHSDALDSGLGKHYDFSFADNVYDVGQ